MTDLAPVLDVLAQLRRLGVSLAVDDFGTGYSSLAYLKRLPVTTLKIDRAFVGRLTEEDGGPELTRAVVMLGATLGLETVAEGIENEVQVTTLLDLGCVAGQGFLFASSCALEELENSPFMSRRARLRSEHAVAGDLTATGRFRVADLWPRSATG